MVLYRRQPVEPRNLLLDWPPPPYPATYDIKSSKAFRYNSLPRLCNWSSSILRSSRVTISPELTLWARLCVTSNQVYRSRVRESLKYDSRTRDAFKRKVSAESIGCACGRSTSAKKFGICGWVGMWFFNFHFTLFLKILNCILFGFSSIYRMSTVNYLLQKVSGKKETSTFFLRGIYHKGGLGLEHKSSSSKTTTPHESAKTKLPIQYLLYWAI